MSATTGIRKFIAKKDVFVLGLILLTTIFLFWKCHYGIAYTDEAFYLTIPFRLYNGDALFVNEWNLSQMSGLLITPIVWLYMTITGGLDGIVLFMRYFFVAVQCAIAIFFYFRFRKLSRLGAACASLSFLLYTPFGIMALSYNSMAIMGLILSITFLGPNDNFKPTSFVFAGISFSAAVLCCPYLAGVYFIYVLSVVIRTVVSNHTSEFFKSHSPIFSIKGVLSITAGAAISAAVFAIFILSRSSPSEVYTALANILNDPSHPPVSFFQSATVYISSVFLRSKVDILIYVCFFVLFLVTIFDKKRNDRKLLYFVAASVGTFTLMIWYICIGYINMVMWSINAMGIFIPLLSGRRSNRTLFFTFWVLGMLYSICSNWASNQHLYAITSASSVATVGSILMIIAFVNECSVEDSKKLQKYIILIVAVVLISTQLISQAVFRYQSVFWEDDGMSAQTEYISEGVQAGLYVSKEALIEHNEMYDRIEKLDKYNAESAVFIAFDTRYYLYGDYKISAFSSWLGRLRPIVLDRLETYYAINPQELPDIGYIEINDPDVDSYIDFVAFAERFASAYGYKWHYEADGIVLVKN